jgi:hypothetical protein
MAKNKVKAKVVIHKTKKKVDWPAAGHKAWLTRLRNKKNGKAPKKAQAKTKKPQVKKPVRHVAQGVGFGKYRVNKIALVNALTEDKRKELKPTEVVQLTWNVIKGANGNVSGHNEKAKRKQ